MLFYPYDFTFVCPTEILSFSAAQKTAFAALNTQVLAISTDSHHTHLAWIRTAKTEGGLGKVDIPLVADTSKQISKSYGVLVEDERSAHRHGGRGERSKREERLRERARVPAQSLNHPRTLVLYLCTQRRHVRRCVARSVHHR